MLFNYNPLRYIRSWFTQVMPAKDRFVKNDKPTQATFEKLENSVAFILERDDRAKTYENTATTNPNLGLQGLVVKNTCANVQARTNPVDLSDNKPYSYAIDATNLPDITGYPEASDDDKILEQSDPEFSTDIIPPYIGNYEYYDNNDGHPMVDEATVVIDKVNDPTKCHTEYIPRISNKFINWIYRGFRYVRKSLTSQNESILDLYDKVDTKINYRSFYKDFWRFQAVEWDTGPNPSISLTPLITVDPVTGPFEYVSFKHVFKDDHLYVYFDIKIRSSLSNYLSDSGIAEFRLRPKLDTLAPFTIADAPQFPPFQWDPSLFSPGRESNTCLFSGYIFEESNTPLTGTVPKTVTKVEGMSMTVEPYWVGVGDFYIRIYKPSNNYYGSNQYHNYVSHTKIYPGSTVGIVPLPADEYGFSLKGCVSFEVNLSQVWLP